MARYKTKDPHPNPLPLNGRGDKKFAVLPLNGKGNKTVFVTKIVIGQPLPFSLSEGEGGQAKRGRMREPDETIALRQPLPFSLSEGEGGQAKRGRMRAPDR